MKKVLIVSGMILLSLCLGGLVREISAGPGDMTGIGGKLDDVNRCRCKHNGCYGGNAISLRAECAKSDTPIDCSDYDGNCPEKDD